MAITLFEIISQKRVLDRKINELKKILAAEQNETLSEEFMALLELRQGKMLNIEAANHASTINIGGTEVNIAVALQLRKTIKEKINLLTTLINNKECSLDKLELQKQRDKYYEEYTLLSMGITKNDMKVTIG